MNFNGGFMGLSTNLRLGEWVKNKTQLLVPFSTNAGDQKTIEQSLLLTMVRKKHPKIMQEQITSWSLSPNPADNSEDHSNRQIYFYDGFGKEHVDTLLNFHNWLKDARDKKASGYHRDGTYRTVLHDIENNAKNSVKHGVGNCDELSGIAYLLLLECPSKYTGNQTIRIEKINITSPGDHCFVVIGRRKNSDLRDPSTWGPDAVICDPWGNVNFSVREQLNKNKSDRLAMFNYITHHLAARDSAFKISQDYVGGGHSQRWDNKGRTNLRHHQNYSKKQQNIPFFHSGGYKFSDVDTMDIAKDEGANLVI
ncbi:TPA: hypothetical protein ACPSKB_000485 [Legionella feeleii]